MRKAELFADLLMGAALADGHLDGRERDRVRTMLLELTHHSALSRSLERRIERFDGAKLDVRRTCDELALRTPDERSKLIELVVAVHESDDVWDLDEDAYLREVAAAVGVPECELAGLAAQDVHLEELGTVLEIQDVDDLAELVDEA